MSIIGIDNKVIDKWMARCIELSQINQKNYEGLHVGSIVVTPKGDTKGEGYRRILNGTKFRLHAERDALDQAGLDTKGCYLITTLEPCMQVKKDQIFKSCCELIKEYEILGVIYGVSDDSIWIRGKPLTFLEQNGIEVRKYKGNITQRLLEIYK